MALTVLPCTAVRGLRDAGFTTVGDVLQYYPRDYLAFGTEIQASVFLDILGRNRFILDSYVT